MTNDPPLSSGLKSNRTYNVKESANRIISELEDSECWTVEIIGLKCESHGDSVNQRKGKVGQVREPKREFGSERSVRARAMAKAAFSFIRRLRERKFG